MRGKALPMWLLLFLFVSPVYYSFKSNSYIGRVQAMHEIRR